MDWLFEALSRVDWTTVLVAMVTGLVAAGGNTWASRSLIRQERLSVRAALIAEVSALLDLVALRGYVSGLREYEHLADDANRTGSPRLFTYDVDIRDNFNQVYQANLNRLGVLHVEEAGQIVRFYQLLDAVRLDVSPGGKLSRGTEDAEDFKEAADLLELAVVIGTRLKNKRVRGGLAKGR